MGFPGIWFSNILPPDGQPKVMAGGQGQSRSDFQLGPPLGIDMSVLYGLSTSNNLFYCYILSLNTTLDVRQNVQPCWFELGWNYSDFG